MGKNKKLERDLSNKIIAGVCSGIAQYFNIDVAFIRILFIIGVLSLSIGFWAYIIFWIVMPGNRYGWQNEKPTSNEEDVNTTKPNTSRGKLILGLCLIIFGIILLVINFIPNFDWSKYWPILLIAAGICLLIPIKTSSNQDEQTS